MVEIGFLDLAYTMLRGDGATQGAGLFAHTVNHGLCTLHLGTVTQ